MDRKEFIKIISGASALFIAAQIGDFTMVEKLIRKDDVDVNQPIGNRGVTPLLIAVQHEHFEVVQALHFSGKLNANSKAADGTTALLIAVQRGCMKMACFLIRMVDVNVNLAGPLGVTPLMVAASRGDLSMVNLLLCHGANINQAMVDNRTAYHFALSHGKKEMLNLFELEHVRISSSMDLMASFSKESLLYFLIEFKNLDYLAQKIELSGVYDYLFVHILKNPAHLSILCDLFKITEKCYWLFSRIANELMFDDGNSVLHLAAEINCATLIDAWSVYTHNMNQNNKHGLTPIQLAVCHGQSAAVKALINAGADLNVEWNGLSLLHMAVDANRGMSHFGIICHLLNAGADINEPRLINKHESVLYIAARENNVMLVKLFLSKKANVSQACSDGMTPFFIACAKEHLEIVNLMLDTSAAQILKEEQEAGCPLPLPVQVALSNRMKTHTDSELNSVKASSILNPERFFTPQGLTSLPHDNQRQHEPPHP